VGGWDTGITSPNEHGFVCSQGQCVSFDVPLSATVTQGDDINAQGDIVGGWLDAGGVLHGFLLSKGSFTNLDFPGAADTILFGINAAGQIVGRYDLADGSNHGFLGQPGNIAKPPRPGGLR
jgi:probable HAF family extracellular repeat protein